MIIISYGMGRMVGLFLSSSVPLPHSPVRCLQSGIPKMVCQTLFSHYSLCPDRLPPCSEAT